jgi:hypothetical protein
MYLAVVLVTGMVLADRGAVAARRAIAHGRSRPVPVRKNRGMASFTRIAPIFPVRDLDVAPGALRTARLRDPHL